MRLMSTNNTDDQINRIWQHGLHEEGLFNNRLNFFLVLESILFFIVAAFINSGASRPFVLRSFTLFGLLITLVWAYVQARQRYVLKVLEQRIRDTAPEFRATDRELLRTRWPISNLTLLTYVVPGLFVLVWIALLLSPGRSASDS